MQEVLVLPRKLIAEMDGFVPWDRTSALIDDFQGSSQWMARHEAERSMEWIQPIPCAVISDGSGNYSVFRPASKVSRNQCLSLIVGGHIDRGGDHDRIMSIFLETLKREVLEEVGITIDHELTSVGMAIDSSSVSASRHIGVVYEVKIESKLKPRAPEEFSLGSKYNGSRLSIKELARLRSQFDPWSSIVFSQHLEPRFQRDMGRQSSFTMLMG